MKIERYTSSNQVEHGPPPDGYLCVLTDEIVDENDPALLLELDVLHLNPADAIVIIIDGRTYIYGIEVKVKS